MADCNGTTPSRDQLLELLDYDRRSGALIWKRRDGVKWFNTRFAGSPAGTIKSKNGWTFVQVCLRGKTYLAHRLIWMMEFDEAPECLDHINGDSTDNRIQNLRPATKSQNGANSKKQKGTSSQFKGVSFLSRSGKFRASIQPHGKNKVLGEFESEIDAAKAYNAAALEIFGEYAALNPV